MEIILLRSCKLVFRIVARFYPHECLQNINTVSRYFSKTLLQVIQNSIPYRTKIRRTKFSADKNFRRTKFSAPGPIFGNFVRPKFLSAEFLSKIMRPIIRVFTIFSRISIKGGNNDRLYVAVWLLGNMYLKLNRENKSRFGPILV